MKPILMRLIKNSFATNNKMPSYYYNNRYSAKVSQHEVEELYGNFEDNPTPYNLLDLFDKMSRFKNSNKKGYFQIRSRLKNDFKSDLTDDIINQLQEDEMNDNSRFWLCLHSIRNNINLNLVIAQLEMTLKSDQSAEKKIDLLQVATSMINTHWRIVKKNTNFINQVNAFMLKMKYSIKNEEYNIKTLIAYFEVVTEFKIIKDTNELKELLDLILDRLDHENISAGSAVGLFSKLSRYRNYNHTFKEQVKHLIQTVEEKIFNIKKFVKFEDDRMLYNRIVLLGEDMNSTYFIDFLDEYLMKENSKTKLSHFHRIIYAFYRYLKPESLSKYSSADIQFFDQIFIANAQEGKKKAENFEVKSMYGQDGLGINKQSNYLERMFTEIGITFEQEAICNFFLVDIKFNNYQPLIEIFRNDPEKYDTEKLEEIEDYLQKKDSILIEINGINHYEPISMRLNYHSLLKTKILEKTSTVLFYNQKEMYYIYNSENPKEKIIEGLFKKLYLRVVRNMKLNDKNMDQDMEED